jgi:hypothetical protein
MEFDQRTQRAATSGATATNSATTPGKRTLTEGLAAQRREAAPATGAEISGGETAASPPATLSLPAGGGPRPTLQMLFGVQRAGRAPAEDAAEVHAAAARGTATAASELPYADRIQRAFGRHDISAIQAHVGPEAAASAREMGARAYAAGDHVVLGDGADVHTVAHEAAHVVQQRGGVQLKSGVGEVGDAYEWHADAVADRVVAGQSAEALLDAVAPAGGSRPGSSAVQQMWSGESSTEHEPVDVYINCDQFAKNMRFTLTSTHVQNTANFYTDIFDKITSNKQLSTIPKDEIKITIRWATNEIPTSGPWPESVPHTEETNYTVILRRTPPDVVDGEMVDFVKSLDPDAVVPCSHIDDTHVEEKGNQIISQEPLRVLSTAQITSQQRLVRVLDALENDRKFTLVLIDPSFGPDGVAKCMIQIVEYLQLHHSTKYSFAAKSGPKCSTIYTCKGVTIVYVGVGLNKKTLDALPQCELL